MAFITPQVRRAVGVTASVLAVVALSACSGGSPGSGAPDATASSSPGPAIASSAGAADGAAGAGEPSSATALPSSASASGGATSSHGIAALQHIVVIVEENKPARSIIGNPQAPYINGLARGGAQATHYSAVTHPSLPNYLALTSGTTAGITSDCNPPGGSCLDTAPNIAEAIDHAGKTWKMYAESMPQPCFTGNTDRYAVKHNPFLYFPSVTRDHAYCAAHDVPASHLSTDLASADSLPNLAVISPDLCNDMHDCSIATGDAWLQQTVPKILASPAFASGHSLLVVAFDEGDSFDNTVTCIFAGPAARAGATVATPFNHYSLLHTIEAGLSLPPLGSNDRQANLMGSMLRAG